MSWAWVAHTLACAACGPLAQMGERLVRNEEPVGSNPMRSTTFRGYLPRLVRVIEPDAPSSCADEGIGVALPDYVLDTGLSLPRNI